MAEVGMIEYVDKYGVQELRESIAIVIANKFANEKTLTINAISTDSNVPTAKAVYDFVTSSQSTIKEFEIVRVIGPITSIVGKENILYIQKDDADDPTWLMYIRYGGEWLCVGDPTPDLQNYWSKSEPDKAALREALGINTLEDKVDALKVITSAMIDTAVNSAFAATS